MKRTLHALLMAIWDFIYYTLCSYDEIIEDGVRGILNIKKSNL